MTIAHCHEGALSFPEAASPTTMKSASPSTTSAAAATCSRFTCCCVSKYPSGSAKTIVVTSSGWITASFPWSSATAWKT